MENNLATFLAGGQAPISVYLAFPGYLSMKKYFVLKTFKRWLAREGHRFFHRPFIQLVRGKYFILKFSGITQKISCIITKSGRVEIWAKHLKENWDILRDFDVCEQHNQHGQYFCKLCEPPELFSSREELWITHSFEPLLNWCNDNFQQGRILIFQGRAGNYSYAVIRGQEDFGKMKANEDFVYACPVDSKSTSVLGNG